MEWPRNSKYCAAPRWFNPAGRIPRRILRKTGYKADSQGIIDRFIRANGAWDEHVQHSRNFILKVLTGKKIDNLAVYGSGWMLDLPLDELSGMVCSLQLFDLVHPPQVIHRLRKYRNVTAYRADITGGAVMKAYQAVKRFKRNGQKTPPEEICSQSFRLVAAPDFVISLNVLSQIGIMITDYLKLHVPYGPDEIDRILQGLQQSHLQLLRPGKSCLITDVREINYDLSGSHAETTEVINIPLPASKYSETWEWQFDDRGDYRPGRRTVLEVAAMEL